MKHNVNLILGGFIQPCLTISSELDSVQLIEAYKRGVEIVGFDLLDLYVRDGIFQNHHIDTLRQHGFEVNTYNTSNNFAKILGHVISKEDMYIYYLSFIRLGCPTFKYKIVKNIENMYLGKNL